MRVFVTGASGNVGSALLRRLRRPDVDHEVVAMSRRPPADGGEERWVAGDLLDADLTSLLRGVDVVVHLAWQIQPSRRPGRTWAVNVEGTDRLLSAVHDAGTPSFVYASSVGAYAPAPAGQVVDEQWPTHGVPTSVYSREKAYVERLLDRFEGDHPDVRVVRLRPALIFQRPAASEIRRFFLGTLFPDRLARPGLAPIFPVTEAVAFQAVHADDVADAYARAIASDAHGAFNVAAEPPLGLRDVAEVLGARPVKVPLRLLRSGARLTYGMRLHPVEPGWVDLAAASPLIGTTRIRDVLGWSPQRSAQDAVRELLHGIADRAGGGTPTLRSDRAVSRLREARTGQGARYARDV